MKNRIILAAIGLIVSLGIGAQDIYQMESFSSQDLNGTARYVGMGGAMSSLGADLSVMNTNPAGIGLYRRSDLGLSFGFVSQEDGEKFDGIGKARASLDQLGFVYSVNVGGSTCRFFNLGFNYHKTKNFHQLLSAGMVNPNYESQTWQLADLANYWGKATDATPLTSMAEQTYLIGDNGNGYEAYGADTYNYQKARTGSVQAYNFNVSTNLSDQFYLGLTIGAYNVDLNSYSLYGEKLVDATNAFAGNSALQNSVDIDGSGFDVKLGFIVRPIAESPFRLGFAVSSPTFYSLHYRSYSRVDVDYSNDANHYWADTEVGAYDYNIHTPWKFNLSLGHTIGNQVAIGAEYEYADYSYAKVSYGSDWYDSWGTYHNNKTDDRELKQQSDRYLKPVSTFKLGVEWMVDPKVAIRMGYNHVTSPFKSNAFVNQHINSASLDYATTTNYMNLSPINRFTVGLGFNLGQVYLDATYQYQNQHGRFYPFTTQNGNDKAINEAASQRINLNRGQGLITIGYRF